MQYDISLLKVDDELLYKVNKNIQQNELILKHFRKLHSEQQDAPSKYKIMNQIERISGCNRFWRVDTFPVQAVRDYVGTFTCKEKFCANCKKLKQVSRMARFIPQIKEHSKQNFMFHLVLTLPSVSGSELSLTIKRMFASYAKLNRYLRGDKKIHGLDFEDWGYLGGLRSLEVTYKNDKYHPHLHCLLICKNNFLTEKILSNIFSMKYGNLTKKFCKEEILIQKIWFLLMEDKKVTAKNVEAVDLGYSCTIDKFKDEDYAELFKYITKNNNGRMTYTEFIVLRGALLNKRQIQGYGILHRIIDDLSGNIEEQVKAIYAEIRKELEAKESPKQEYLNSKMLFQDCKNLLISKKRIYSMLRQEKQL